ncbi:hypothetical protein K7J14_05310 [Treponema zuelzerae]|uniref:Actin-like ATPase domain-containing protein n=1 Tax=Teretinema zuelzerae TaxID=156 RepID=A0AAE3JIC7_9SPIR|nr:hypothetical protein [Teretinema zuelzerae]MCD1654118.1 hypothetical protein [Teretinema zuelzerae]
MNQNYKKSFSTKNTIVDNHLDEPIEIIIGLDFGTSYSKVCYSLQGVKGVPVDFMDDNGQPTCFKPTKVYFSNKSKRLYYTKPQKEVFDCIQYFKYTMIRDVLQKSRCLQKHCGELAHNPETLCSVFFIASLLREVFLQIQTKVGQGNAHREIRWTVNMGVPIENYDDVNLKRYDLVLHAGFQLSSMLTEASINLFELDRMVTGFQNQPDWLKNERLTTLPELYAESMAYLKDPQTSTGFYTIIDIGGGTTDLATLYISRDNGSPECIFLSQKVIPLGVEALVDTVSASYQRSDTREKIKNYFQNTSRLCPDPTLFDESKYKECEKLFREAFANVVMNAKEKYRDKMDLQYKSKNYLPYFMFGGGSEYKWYHSVIFSHLEAFHGAKIPDLKRVPLTTYFSSDFAKTDPYGRLLIARMLATSHFPPIKGFPWHFTKQEIKYRDENREELLEDRQKELYGK